MLVRGRACVRAALLYNLRRLQRQSAMRLDAASAARLRAELTEAQQKVNKLKQFKTEADSLRRQVSTAQDACKVLMCAGITAARCMRALCLCL